MAQSSGTRDPATGQDERWPDLMQGVRCKSWTLRSAGTRRGRVAWFEQLLDETRPLRALWLMAEHNGQVVQGVVESPRADARWGTSVSRSSSLLAAKPIKRG